MSRFLITRFMGALLCWICGLQGPDRGIMERVVHEFNEVEGISGATLNLMVSIDHFRQEAAMRLGIGISGLKVLGFLGRNSGMTAGMLATATDVTSGSMTATIDKLEAQGLVARVQSETDRRSVTVQTTEDGQRAISWLTHNYRAALSSALAGTPDADEQVISAYLNAASELIRETADNLPDITQPTQ
ncbi:MAG: MarR family winged helix-turn-helix transcriptional regulator [Rhodoglobus sp.]